MDFCPNPSHPLPYFKKPYWVASPANDNQMDHASLQMKFVHPDPIAYQDDMAHVADVLEENRDDRTLDYVAQFLGGVARSAKDHSLLKATEALAAKCDAGEAASSETARIVGLIQERLTERIAI